MCLEVVPGMIVVILFAVLLGIGVGKLVGLA